MNADDEDKLIRRAENTQFTRDELLTYYKNVQQRGATPRVLKVIEARLHREFPQAARSMFGAKEEHAMDMLTRLSLELGAVFDFSANKVGNHVRTGGDEISGAAFLCRYLSYKNSDNQGAQITLAQSAFDSELRITVDRYQTNAKEHNYRDGQDFAVGEFDAAAGLYRRYLGELGVPPRRAA